MRINLIHLVSLSGSTEVDFVFGSLVCNVLASGNFKLVSLKLGYELVENHSVIHGSACRKNHSEVHFSVLINRNGVFHLCFAKVALSVKVSVGMLALCGKLYVTAAYVALAVSVFVYTLVAFNLEFFVALVAVAVFIFIDVLAGENFISAVVTVAVSVVIVALAVTCHFCTAGVALSVKIVILVNDSYACFRAKRLVAPSVVVFIVVINLEICGTTLCITRTVMVCIHVIYTVNRYVISAYVTNRISVKVSVDFTRLCRKSGNTDAGTRAGQNHYRQKHQKNQ